jgi:putative transposase
MFRDARVLVFSIFAVLIDAMTFVFLSLRSSSALAAENLFLRKQLAMYVERKQKPRRATDSDRFMLAQLMRFFDWPSALTVVKPDTLVRWHRKGFRLFWKWKSQRAGRPSIPMDLRKLIGDMATNNPTWGEGRISDELLLKLGIQISPRTVRRYMPLPPEGQETPTRDG